MSDVDVLEFSGSKLGDDNVLWQALAPYIDSRAKIEFSSDDENLNRVWSFEDGKIQESWD